ncbi:PREDICTED: olfactory receptor 2AG1-like [Miniopterus natalensis]|uniref:olfactory receptor 2AG1-like n=1 Tax=Miniopterus natalensis TaxID=291302 RepID=UPI0007A6DB8F|nr:PREDICTED: olfactory receptor 2AG1-like [Miniopterus natalensis]
MEHWNSTLGSGFILMGILKDSGSPGLLCATITVLYMLALTSNGLLLLVITMDVQLHVPMYLLLGQLSLMDLLFTSVVTPKALMDFLPSENTISFGGCALQMFLALTLGAAEDLLLAFMAYDRCESTKAIFLLHRNCSRTGLALFLCLLHHSRRPAREEKAQKGPETYFGQTPQTPNPT